MISVCIATYNGEKYIKEQLSSILKQLSLNDEIVISDDGSIDSTIEVIETFKDKRIRIIVNNLEKGYSKNFENSIINARGDVIFLSDQDDVWMDDKVAKMIKSLETSTMVVSNAQFVDEGLNELEGTYFSLRGYRSGLLNNLYKSRYLGACMAFKREMLQKLLPFPQKQFLCPHDYWLTLVGEFYYKVNIINEPLIKYRRHIGNASNGGIQSGNTLFGKLTYRIYSLILLFKRA
ncbi:MAG: glycosyltransferase family 2 protein [Bacteroidota bacterium]